MGVFPGLLSAPWLSTGLPHVRGGVSQTGWADIDSLLSSPRAWGCFHFCVGACYHLQVFPTCVGVFLEAGLPDIQGAGLPHVRGGVSKIRAAQDKKIRSSPRAWGCFSMTDEIVAMMPVFPTCVGVFPVFSCSAGLTRTSSPRAWGCFSVFEFHFGLHPVFPTCVGVFPTSSRWRLGCRGLPHVRGGVSGPASPLSTR